MDAQIVQMVQQSWARVLPNAPRVAALFYERLFALDPSLAPMFRGDMRVQGARLMAMIGSAVLRLHKIDTLLPVLRDLGRRHEGYGVRAAHYETVGLALLQTLESGLGEAFTPSVRAAWSHVYAVMANAMLEACETVEAR